MTRRHYYGRTYTAAGYRVAQIGPCRRLWTILLPDGRLATPHPFPTLAGALLAAHELAARPPPPDSER